MAEQILRGGGQRAEQQQQPEASAARAGRTGSRSRGPPAAAPAPARRKALTASRISRWLGVTSTSSEMVSVSGRSPRAPDTWSARRWSPRAPPRRSAPACVQLSPSAPTPETMMAPAKPTSAATDAGRRGALAQEQRRAEDDEQRAGGQQRHHLPDRHAGGEAIDEDVDAERRDEGADFMGQRMAWCAGCRRRCAGSAAAPAPRR